MIKYFKSLPKAGKMLLLGGFIDLSISAVLVYFHLDAAAYLLTLNYLVIGGGLAFSKINYTDNGKKHLVLSVAVLINLAMLYASRYRFLAPYVIVLYLLISVYFIVKDKKEKRTKNQV